MNAQASRQTIANRREHAYFDEQEYRRFQELTDISERLSIPIETPITFLRGEDGLVYSTFGDRVVDVVQNGYHEALQAAQFRSDIGFEVERRRLEVDEALTVESLGDGQAMMVVSMIPDAVREGKTNIDGYNRERLRTMVRFYFAHDRQITNVSLSLDKSDYQGLQAVAGAVGGILPDGLSSEQVLGQRYMFNTDQSQTEWLPSRAREAYDITLNQKYGGFWYAGTPFASQQDALSFVMQQPDLITEHMAAIADVVGLVNDTKQKNNELEKLRRRFAAAVDLRVHGKTIGSLGDASVSAGVSSGGYGGDCASDLSSVQSTSDQLSNMGMRKGNLLDCVKCPLPNCGKTVNAKRTQHGGIFCPACKREARGGKIFDHNEAATPKQKHNRQIGNKAIAATQIQHESKPNKLTKDYQYVGTKNEVGGAKKLYKDKHGELIEV